MADYLDERPIEGIPPPKYDAEMHDEKAAGKTGAYVGDQPVVDIEAGHQASLNDVMDSANDIVTNLITVEDDPSVTPWTFRMLFIGIGLSIFGGVLQEIFYFKPQVIVVSNIFLTVIAYPLGEALAFIIPRRGPIGRWLNPFPFNAKEHAAIVLMSSAAAQSALATEALTAQELYYGGYPNRAAGVFVVLSSQLLGFGVAGLLRDVIVRPTKMIWPVIIPIATLLESIHKHTGIFRKRLKAFWIIFGIAFVWEWFPEYIFTVLEGVSIFCLADQHNLVFTNLFGGSSGNEGLGILSFCFDWNYISNPLPYPLYTLTNGLIGILGCYALFAGVYYGNVWNSLRFPFLTQLLFYGDSNSTYVHQYNQSLILAPDYTINSTALHEQGIPWLSGSYVLYMITSNMATTAALVHLMLWDWDSLRYGFSWLNPSAIRRLLSPNTWKFWIQESDDECRERIINDENLDPHYRLLVRNGYKDVPIWWWAAVLIGSFAVGLGCLYKIKSTLPWWGFIIGNILVVIFVLFLGAQSGLTAFGVNIQPFCQMLAGYLFPRRPLANLYFTCFSYNAVNQGLTLARDLRLAQDVHLSPRCTFFSQIIGCVIGAIFNYIMMLSIVKAQRPVLLSVNGTNIWSGANVQQFNSMSMSMSMAKDLFSVGGRYQYVTISYLFGFIAPVPFWALYKLTKWRIFSYINTSIIVWYMGDLFIGDNSSLTMYYIIGFLSQLWLRKLHPAFFNKYNYIVSAALDGGTQICVFVMSFAVLGAYGSQHPFPTWAGNPDPTAHFVDYCMVNPAA